MAPGQAELKYVDVRVTRPTALPAGASPGFEETAPGAEFVAEKAEVSLTLDAKLPPPFRKDLKNLIKNRLEGLSVPVDIKETVIPFPTPRPQPTTPPEMPFRYPPMPQMQQPTPAARGPDAAAGSPDAAARGGRARAAFRCGWRSCSAFCGLLIGGFVAALFALRRRDKKDAAQARPRPKAATPARWRRRRRRSRPITCPRSGARCARIACSPGA